MLKYLFLAALGVANVHGDGAQEGNVWCNYTGGGDEVTSAAVPIADFRTSGDDFPRPAWCIAHCTSRTSLRATMNYKPSNQNAPRFHVRTVVHGPKHIEITSKLIKGEPGTKPVPIGRSDEDMYCWDLTVAATVDAVVDKYNTTETISEALNYYINRPQWAYLVYQMGVPPSIDGTVNAFQDPDFCMKTAQSSDGSRTYQIFAGYVSK